MSDFATIILVGATAGITYVLTKEACAKGPITQAQEAAEVIGSLGTLAGGVAQLGKSVRDVINGG